jgi:hypothetical protein
MKLINKVIVLLIIAGAYYYGYGQITSVQSGNWSETSTWDGGVVPTATNNVIIGAGQTVTVDAEASCKDISFGDDNSKIAMNANLNCYGDFALYSTSHNAFSDWTTGIKFVFKGPEPTQTISGFSSTGFSTSFNELVVDKSTGKVTTDGSDMRLGIGNSLEIINGVFELATPDDIEGRTFNSSPSSPTVMIQSDGIFNMLVGASHIRRASNTGNNTSKIGMMTVYGEANLTSTSSNRVNLSGIDIENGGVITISAGWSTSGPRFNPGTITIKNGGTLLNTINTNIWYDNTDTPNEIALKSGGVFENTSSVPTFPTFSENQGTILYSRNISGSDQPIVDMDYYNLETRRANSGAKKNWTLSADRIITGDFTNGYSAESVILSDVARKITIQGTLRLTSGGVDNSDPEVTIEMANEAEISRATGTITNTVSLAGIVNARYFSTSDDITTGVELPSVINDLTIITSEKTIKLNNNLEVTGDLTLSSGTFDNNGASDDKVLNMTDGASIRRATGTLTTAPTFEGKVNLEYISVVDPVTTGAEVPVDPTKLNDVTISSTKGVTLGSDMTVNGVLNITGSNLTTTNSYAVYLGTSAANPSESTGKSIVGKAVMNQRNIGTGGLNILGVNLAAGTDDIGNVTITRITGEDGRITVGENTGINCNWDITVGTQPSSGRNVTFSWLSDFDNGKNMEQATLWKKDGENWNRIIAATNVSGNDPREFAATGITTFSQWTVSDDSSPLPVELTSFAAAVSGKSVNLNWQTATEVNNYGFEVERSEKRETGSENWEKVGFVAGYGNSNSTKEYSFSDDISQLLSLYLNPSLTLPKDYTLRYRLKQIDNDGNYSYSNEVIVETLTATSLPTEYALHQNYPNPFNPVTKIDYALKSDANVKVELFSVIGEKISVLINENQNAGNHTFEINASKMRLTSGIYLVRFSATELSGGESYSKVIKMVLNK